MVLTGNPAQGQKVTLAEVEAQSEDLVQNLDKLEAWIDNVAGRLGIGNEPRPAALGSQVEAVSAYLPARLSQRLNRAAASVRRACRAIDEIGSAIG
jgi:hypothetical protein